MAVVLFSIVAFGTDFGGPSIWAFTQDVGGRHVGSVLGWGNMWGNLGASNGNENGAKLRDLVAKKMTPADISKAQRLARECVKKNYKGC